MYETSSPIDGYKALNLYLSKLNPKCEAFFQFPRRDWSEEKSAGESYWYENRPLGINSLGSMMTNKISKAAKLSKVYTNHCVRSTAITLWSQAGIEDRKICHISGHKNPASLRHYNSQPSAQQLRECSNVLSGALHGIPNPVVHGNHQPQTSTKATFTSAEVHFTRMFDSCSIQSVNINLFSSPSSSSVNNENV